MLYFHTFMFARWRDNFPAHTHQSQRSCDWYAVIGRYDISLGLSLTACFQFLNFKMTAATIEIYFKIIILWPPHRNFTADFVFGDFEIEVSLNTKF